jgi:hypothetical protein
VADLKDLTPNGAAAPAAKKSLSKRAIALAVAAGFGAGTQVTPDRLAGPPASGDGVVCHAERTGALSAVQVCTFGFGDAGGFDVPLEPIAPAPDAGSGKRSHPDRFRDF